MRPTAVQVKVGGVDFSMPLSFAAVRAFHNAGLSPDLVVAKLARAGTDAASQVASLPVVQAVETIMVAAQVAGVRGLTEDAVSAAGNPLALRVVATEIHMALVLMFGPERVTETKVEGTTPPKA